MDFVSSFFIDMEVFKDVPNYEGIYQVSNFGNVKSKKWNKEKLLKKNLNNCGYFCVEFSKKGERKKYNIHVLVGMTFLNYKPNGKQDFVIDHKNEIKTDNKVENLQIISNRENISKSIKNKIVGSSWNSYHKKFSSIIRIKKERIFLGYFKTDEEAGRMYEKALNQINKFNGNKKDFKNLLKNV